MVQLNLRACLKNKISSIRRTASIDGQMELNTKEMSKQVASFVVKERDGRETDPKEESTMMTPCMKVISRTTRWKESAS